MEEGHVAAVQNRHPAVTIAQHSNNATLAPNLRNLFVIWKDYEFGVSGRKPAAQGIHAC
jgi:hypothetical protein